MMGQKNLCDIIGDIGTQPIVSVEQGNVHFFYWGKDKKNKCGLPPILDCTRRSRKPSTNLSSGPVPMPRDGLSAPTNNEEARTPTGTPPALLKNHWFALYILWSVVESVSANLKFYRIITVSDNLTTMYLFNHLPRSDDERLFFPTM